MPLLSTFSFQICGVSTAESTKLVDVPFYGVYSDEHMELHAWVLDATHGKHSINAVVSRRKERGTVYLEPKPCRGLDQAACFFQ